METQRILLKSLAVAVVIAAVIWTTTGEENKLKSCCTKVSTAEVTDPIIGFWMQRGSPPCVKAVIFKTERGEFCSDWRQPWVKRKILQFWKVVLKAMNLTFTPPSTSSTSDQAGVGRSTQASDSS